MEINKVGVVTNDDGDWIVIVQHFPPGSNDPVWVHGDKVYRFRLTASMAANRVSRATGWKRP